MAVLNINRTCLEHGSQQPNVNQPALSSRLVQSVRRGNDPDVCGMFYRGAGHDFSGRRIARKRTGRTVYQWNYPRSYGAAVGHRKRTPSVLAAQGVGVDVQHRHNRHRLDELLLHSRLRAIADILVKAGNKRVVREGAEK